MRTYSDMHGLFFTKEEYEKRRDFEKQIKNFKIKEQKDKKLAAHILMIGLITAFLIFTLFNYSIFGMLGLITLIVIEINLLKKENKV